MSRPTASATLFPALLKHWRRQRGFSQLDLAVDANVSSRHISFLETGRSRPSAEMVLRLAAALGVPLRHTDEMLRAAGHDPKFGEPDGDPPAQVVAAVHLMGEHHEPFPMFVLDRCYQVRHANRGARRMLAAVLGPTPAEQVNLARATFDPDGAMPAIVNFDVVGRELLWRIHREVLDSGNDPDLRHLLEELLLQPTIAPDWRTVDLSADTEPVLTVHLRHGHTDLRFLVAVTSFAGPQNVAAAELRIETWFPADEPTATACRLLDESD